MAANSTSHGLASDLLPKGTVAWISRWWDWVTARVALPARALGFDRKRVGWRDHAPVVLFFGFLLLIPLFAMEWVPGAETVRQAGVQRLPAWLRHFLLDPITSLLFLSAALIAILSVNREWSINEKERERLVVVTDPNSRDVPPTDGMADLRWLGVGSAFLVLLVLPLWLNALNRTSCDGSNACMYSASSSILVWLWYCAEQCVPSFIALPEFLRAPVVENSPLAAWPKHIVSPLVFGLVVFSALEIRRLNAVSELAVDSLHTGSGRAIAMGRRILPTLQRVFEFDGDRGLPSRFYRHAATAMGALKAVAVLPLLEELANHRNSHVRGRAIDALGNLLDGDEGAEAKSQILQILRKRLLAEPIDGVRNKIKALLERHDLSATTPSSVSAVAA